MRSSKPGDWSIVIIDEYLFDRDLEPKWQYAFITPCNDDAGEPNRRFVVMDMTSFLAEVLDNANKVQKLSERWEVLRQG